MGRFYQNWAIMAANSSLPKQIWCPALYFHIHALYAKAISTVTVHACVQLELQRMVSGWFGTLLCRRSAATRNISAQQCATHALLCARKALLCRKMGGCTNCSSQKCTAGANDARAVNSTCATHAPVAQKASTSV